MALAKEAVLGGLVTGGGDGGAVAGSLAIDQVGGEGGEGVGGAVGVEAGEGAGGDGVVRALGAVEDEEVAGGGVGGDRLGVGEAGLGGGAEGALGDADLLGLGGRGEEEDQQGDEESRVTEMWETWSWIGHCELDRVSRVSECLRRFRWLSGIPGRREGRPGIMRGPSMGWLR